MPNDCEEGGLCDVRYFAISSRGGELAEVGAVQVEAVQRWVGGMAIGGMSVGESPWRGGWGYA